MILNSNNVIDLQGNIFTTTCPHKDCGLQSSLTLISLLKYHEIMGLGARYIGLVFLCNACKEPIFTKHFIIKAKSGIIEIDDTPEFIQPLKESFEFKYLPEPVLSDFIESLDCFSIGAFNGFAAMARRTIQSTASNLGAKGKSKIQHQIQELKEIIGLDEELFDVLKQIVIDGHDGAHPHLPSLNRERAMVLLELMKDIMYQLYVRKGKIEEASALRTKQIKEDKT